MGQVLCRAVPLDGRKVTQFMHLQLLRCSVPTPNFIQMLGAATADVQFPHLYFFAYILLFTF